MRKGEIVFDGLPSELTEAMAREIYGVGEHGAGEGDDDVDLAFTATQTATRPRTRAGVVRRAAVPMPGKSPCRTSAVGGRGPAKAIQTAASTLTEETIMHKQLRQICGLVRIAGPVGCRPARQSAAGKYIGGWQKNFPVVKYGVIPVETQSNTSRAWTHSSTTPKRRLGVKWELYTATDYSGVMNALIAKQIHLSWLSGSQLLPDPHGQQRRRRAAGRGDGARRLDGLQLGRRRQSRQPLQDHRRPEGQSRRAHRSAVRIGLPDPDRGVSRRWASRSTSTTRARSSGGHPQGCWAYSRGPTTAPSRGRRRTTTSATCAP